MTAKQLEVRRRESGRSLHVPDQAESFPSLKMCFAVSVNRGEVLKTC